jgi:hypothetical protein
VIRTALAAGSFLVVLAASGCGQTTAPTRCQPGVVDAVHCPGRDGEQLARLAVTIVNRSPGLTAALGAFDSVVAGRGSTSAITSAAIAYADALHSFDTAVGRMEVPAADLADLTGVLTLDRELEAEVRGIAQAAGALTPDAWARLHAHEATRYERWQSFMSRVSTQVDHAGCTVVSHLDGPARFSGCTPRA